MDAKVVETLTIVKPVTVYIRYYEGGVGGSYPYDWFTEGGAESDLYFETREEAIIDAQGKYL